MSKMSRRKGHDFEREVARRLSVAGRTPVERQLHEVRDGNLGDLVSDLPCVFQCKVGASPSVWKAVREADEATDGTGRYAVAIVRRNRAQGRPKQDVAVLPLEDFEMILAELRGMGVW